MIEQCQNMASFDVFMFYFWCSGSIKRLSFPNLFPSIHTTIHILSNLDELHCRSEIKDFPQREAGRCRCVQGVIFHHTWVFFLKNM